MHGLDWVGLGWVGTVWVELGYEILCLGWVGLGRVQCQKYLINIQFTRKNGYSTTIICNEKVAILALITV